MRTVDNPPQRFHSCYVEWLEEPPPAKLRVHEETTTRTILAKNDSPDIPFTYSLNPYRGCTHACAYCYARPSHEYLDFGAGTDFDTQVVVKLNAAEILRKTLEKRSWEGDLIAFSGDTDCYQPLESHYGITRACLEVCRDYENPVGIVTKSHLITRDVDLLAELAERCDLTVYFSIAFDDPVTSRVIEPGAPRPSKRLEAMKTLADAGVPVAVLFAPIIPGLNEEAIPRVLEAAAEAGATEASRILLRLPGPVAEIFLKRVQAGLPPERAARIESRIRELRGGGLNETRFGKRFQGIGPYWQAIEQLFELHRTKAGLNRGRRTKPEPRGRRPRPGDQLGLFDG